MTNDFLPGLAIYYLSLALLNLGFVLYQLRARGSRFAKVLGSALAGLLLLHGLSYWPLRWVGNCRRGSRTGPRAS